MNIQLMMDEFVKTYIKKDDLDFKMYSPPDVTVFGQSYDKRVEHPFDMDSLDDRVLQIFEKLDNKESVKIVDKGLDGWELRTLDHMYGIMLQQKARDKLLKDLDYRNDLKLDLGLLSIHTDSYLYEVSRFVGKRIMGETLGFMRDMLDEIFKNDLYRYYQAIESKSRLIYPLPNASYKFTKDGKIRRPFANYDMGFGGLFGLSRLQIVSDTKIVSKDIEQKTKEFMLRSYNEFRQAIGSVQSMIEDAVYDKMIEVADDFKQTYTGE